jgi:hypothetical protein
MPEQIDVHEYRRKRREEQTRERFEEWVAENKREHRQFRKKADDDVVVRSDREIEIEHAFWTNIDEFLPHVLKEERSIRGALRRINSELESMSHYDTDDYGLVSEPTFYKWVDKWAQADETTDRNRRVLKQFVR